MRIAIWLAAALAVTASTAAFADESAIQLKKGTGLDAIEGNCGACHSLDYIQMNSPIQDKEGWSKTVTKMVKALGAPITDDDQKTIIDYLAANYSK